MNSVNICSNDAYVKIDSIASCLGGVFDSVMVEVSKVVNSYPDILLKGLYVNDIMTKCDRLETEFQMHYIEGLSGKENVENALMQVIAHCVVELLLMRVIDNKENKEVHPFRKIISLSDMVSVLTEARQTASDQCREICKSVITNDSLYPLLKNGVLTGDGRVLKINSGGCVVLHDAPEIPQLSDIEEQYNE